MMKEAVGERSAELFVEEDKEQCDFAPFVCEAVGIMFSVAGEQSMSL